MLVAHLAKCGGGGGGAFTCERGAKAIEREDVPFAPDLQYHSQDWTRAMIVTYCEGATNRGHGQSQAQEIP